MTATTEQPSPLQPIGLGLSDAMEQGAREWARKWRLIDADGHLHCAGCGEVTPWHVSLHCPPCRVDELRDRPERLRRERQAELERQQREREEEQSRPQRVGGRSFRDGY